MGGHVNRTTLESFYQSAGDVYDDAKTEGALEVLADQIDENWDGVLGKTNTTAYTPTAQHHPATKGYVDNAIVGVAVAELPTGSIGTEYITDEAITYAKTDADVKTALNGGLIYAYKNLGGAL